MKNNLRDSYRTALKIHLFERCCVRNPANKSALYSSMIFLKIWNFWGIATVRSYNTMAWTMILRICDIMKKHNNKLRR